MMEQTVDQLYRLLKSAFKELGLAPVADDTNLTLTAVFDEVPVFSGVSDKRKVISFSAYIPEEVPADRRAAVARAVAFINLNLSDGNFNLNMGDGSLLFYTAAPTTGVKVERELLQYKLTLCRDTALKYALALRRVMQEDLTLNETAELIRGIK